MINTLMWCVILCFFVVVEASGPAILTIWFMPGCLAAILLSLMGFSPGWQIASFLVGTVITICFFKQISACLARKPQDQPAAMVGRKFRLLADTNEDLESCVEKDGVTWRVCCLCQMKQGQEGIVTRVCGNRLVIQPAPSATDLQRRP